MIIEPEELTKAVGAARFTPPEVQLAGFVQAIGRVAVPPLLQECRDGLQSGKARSLFFSEVVHSPKVGHEQCGWLGFSVATAGCQAQLVTQHVPVRRYGERTTLTRTPQQVGC